MPPQKLTIDLPVYLSRYIPGAVLADTVRRCSASGVIDSVSVWDQTAFFFPRSMWTPEVTDVAGFIRDIDSFPDPFSAMGYIAANAPDLALSVGTDAVRRSPGELMQALLTLTNFNGGNGVLVHMGAGEIKNQDPFGWKHSQGMSRLRDHLRAFHALWQANGPIEFEGKWWQFDGAWVGNATKDLPRPRMHGLGGGPTLLDITSSYADGFTATAPLVAATPEEWAEMISDMKARLVEKDRDPDDFGFALYPICCLIHEDENVLDRAMENKLFKWITALWGRINQSAWLKEGIQPPMGTDWHYANHFFPHKVGEAEIEEILGRVTREMVEKALVIGTPEQVAKRCQEYVDAGTTWLQIGDFMPWAADPEDGARSFDRCLEVARQVKGATVAAA